MGFPLGGHQSAETRAKISAALAGNTYALGSRHTAESRARTGAGNRGKIVSAETRQRIAAANTGKVLSPTTRARLSASSMGKTISSEQRAKISRTLRAKDIGPCAYCGAPSKGWDHVVPRGRPGAEAQGNLVRCCNSCNPSKSNRTPEEWLAYLERRVPQLERELASMAVKLAAVREYVRSSR